MVARKSPLIFAFTLRRRRHRAESHAAGTASRARRRLGLGLLYARDRLRPGTRVGRRKSSVRRHAAVPLARIELRFYVPLDTK